MFMFVKRQVVRFAMKSRRGPHVPLGHNAPKVRSVLHTCPHACSKSTMPNRLNVISHFCCTYLLHLKELRQEIEAKLSHVQKIHFEPRLLTPDDDRLKHTEHSGESAHTHRHTGTQCVVSFAGQLKVCIYVRAGSYDYLYRMRALDAIRAAGEPCHR